MKACIIGSHVCDKYALINFQIDSFVGDAIAFPIRFSDSGSVRLSTLDFESLLSKGSYVDITFSKKMNRYVVRF